MHPSTNDAVFIDNDFFRNTKGHDLVANSYLQAGKLIAASFRPFVFHVFERREVLHDPDIALDLTEGSAHGSVDPIFRDQNTTTQVVCFAQRALPQTDRFRISEWRELVEENDLLRSDVQNFNRAIAGLFLRFSGLWTILIRVRTNARALMF